MPRLGRCHRRRPCQASAREDTRGGRRRVWPYNGAILAASKPRTIRPWRREHVCCWPATSPHRTTTPSHTATPRRADRVYNTYAAPMLSQSTSPSQWRSTASSPPEALRCCPWRPCALTHHLAMLRRRGAPPANHRAHGVRQRMTKEPSPTPWNNPGWISGLGLLGH
jgi:hypothetical protein